MLVSPGHCIEKLFKKNNIVGFSPDFKVHHSGSLCEPLSWCWRLLQISVCTVELHSLQWRLWRVVNNQYNILPVGWEPVTSDLPCWLTIAIIPELLVNDVSGLNSTCNALLIFVFYTFTADRPNVFLLFLLLLLCTTIPVKVNMCRYSID